MSNPNLDSGGIGGGSSSSTSDGDNTEEDDNDSGGSTPDPDDGATTTQTDPFDNAGAGSDAYRPGTGGSTNSDNSDSDDSSTGGGSSRPDRRGDDRLDAPGGVDSVSSNGGSGGSNSSGGGATGGGGSADPSDEPVDTGSPPDSDTGIGDSGASGGDTSGGNRGDDTAEGPGFDPRPDQYTDPEDTGSTELERRTTDDDVDTSPDPLVETEEGAPDPDNTVVERRLNQAEEHLAEQGYDRDDYTLTVTDSGWVEFGGLTNDGQLEAAQEALESDYEVDSTDIRRVGDDAYVAEVTTESGGTLNVNIPFGDEAAEYFEEQRDPAPGDGPNPADERASRRVGGTGNPTAEPASGREDDINEFLDRNTPTPSQQPSGRVDTPGDAPDMRNRTSESLPDVQDRLEARVARGNENLSPGDVTVDWQEEGMVAPEAPKQDASTFKVTLSKEGRQKLREEAEQDQEEQFGDYQVTVPFTGGNTVEDYLEAGASGYSETVRDASSALFDKGGVASESIIAEGLEATGQDEAATAFEEGLRSFGKGTFEGAAQLGNVPGVAAGVKEGGELVGYGVEETVAGRGGEFVDQTGAAAGAAVAGAVDYAKANPAKFTGQAVGSLAGSYTIMSGAAKVSPRVGAASRYAIQPGEELVTGAATKLAKRTATGQRALNKIPGGRIDNEEIAIAAGRKAKRKLADSVENGVARRFLRDTTARGQLVPDTRGRSVEAGEPSDMGDTITLDSESLSTERQSTRDPREAKRRRKGYQRSSTGPSDTSRRGRSRGRGRDNPHVDAGEYDLSAGYQSGELELEQDADAATLNTEIEGEVNQDVGAELETEPAPQSELAVESRSKAVSEVRMATELSIDQRTEAITASDLSGHSATDTRSEMEMGSPMDMNLEMETESVMELDQEAELETESESELEMETETETEFESEYEYESELESEVEFEYESEKEAELPPPGDELAGDSGPGGSGEFQNVFEYSVASSTDVLTGGLDEG